MSETIDVTVAAVIEQQERFLLVEEVVAGETVLNQPAGHVEPAEGVLDAVVRETLEETGYHFVPSALIGIYSWRSDADGRSFLRLCFAGSAEPPDGPVVLDDGIIAPRWLGLSELSSRAGELRSPLVMQAIDDYLAGHRYPLDSIRHIVGPPASASRRAAG